MAWLETVITVAPSAEPITLDQAKVQCRVEDTTAFDPKLTSYIAPARGYVENYCGIKLITQTVQMRCSTFDDLAWLPAAPMQSISGITYLDTNGTSQTLDPTLYAALLYGLSPKVRFDPLATLPGLYDVADAITVTGVAGYGDATKVPAPLIQAILMLVSHWFDSPTVAFDMRGNPSELPHSVSSLLANYRR